VRALLQKNAPEAPSIISDNRGKAFRGKAREREKEREREKACGRSLNFLCRAIPSTKAADRFLSPTRAAGLLKGFLPAVWLIIRSEEARDEPASKG